MVITIFGLGFVGLTTALGFAEYGHTVYGIEINNDRLNTIKSGKLPFLEPGLDEALKHHLNKHFYPISAEQLTEAVSESDCIYYCVGTPYGKNGEADLTYLFKAIDETLDAVKDDRFRVLVIKSTVPPSTCTKKIIPYLENKGVKVGEKYGIANNPEFLREGHCWSDFMNADRIVLGVSDKKSEAVVRMIYENERMPVFCVSLNTGEFVKYLSNTLLATLISYSNEMSVIADTIGSIDVAQAFHILHMDKRWGGCDMTSYVYPGCGYGGYCLPKDTNALYAITKLFGFNARILENVIATNDNMPEYIVDRITKKIGAGDKNIKIAILGLSFKPGSDDVRDAPSAKIIERLFEVGYKNIYAYDPVANQEFKSRYALNVLYYSDYDQLITDADVFVIATAWPQFKGILSITKKPVVDCRYML